MRRRTLRLLAGLLVLGGHRPAAAQASRLDSIRTDDAVLALIRPLGWEYAAAVLGDSAVSAYRPYRNTRFAVRGGQTWCKADFDGNGRTDLLVLARRADIPLVFCVLDMGGSRLRAVRSFYNAVHRRQPTAQVVYRRGQALLRYTDFARRRGSNGRLRNRHTQLLAYTYGAFLPVQRRPTRHRIEAIRLTWKLTYHDHEELDLRIEPDDRAYLQTTEYPVLAPQQISRQALTTQLDSACRADMAGLLNYVRFSRCRNQYDGGDLNHHPRVELTITYDGGRTKTIRDANGEGTPGLEYVYTYLVGLRRSQRWQPTTASDDHVAPPR
ncbi:hypothetical protein [Hymenobacter jeollabukensis]|uniref:VCBS repeat-containing protein n=1 Tax=Hymenobacter jeollabukensis TaxID=2025313 RepID=A0A5R8WX51_9BACT|nr:hypothetical protein [Hymenobacter jeollabukensis]TLM97088.1 hypothetical protein FDY95_03595 [Hymenobacter jeollabukensis]